MDLFDIIGPVMVGPSSSHTAGAARIGQVVLSLLDEPVVKADIGFHGSFAKTFEGHGTNRAIAGGLMGMGVDDLQLKNSLQIAQEKGLAFTFHTLNLKGAHPNTVVVDAFSTSLKHINVQAASVGGGNIRINAINGLQVSFSGKENTLVIQHQDLKGVIARVSSLLAENDLNIATMLVFRQRAGADAVMAIELDGSPDAPLLDSLKQLPQIQTVSFLARRFG